MNEPQLLHDLSELYSKLKYYDKAIRVLTEALVGNKQHKIQELNSLIEESKLLILLARVYVYNEQQDESLNTWRRAHEVSVCDVISASIQIFAYSVQVRCSGKSYSKGIVSKRNSI